MPALLHHPEANSFVRRVMLMRTSKGKPYAVFRANQSNKNSVWYKPVPYCISDYTYQREEGPILVYDFCVAPLSAYSEALEATAHIPIDHQFVGGPNEPLSYFPPVGSPIHTYTEVHMGDIGWANAVKRVQRLTAYQTYERTKRKYPGMPVDQILADLSSRMLVPRSSVRHMLISEGVVLPNSGSLNISVSKEHRFDKSFAFRYHYAMLTRIIQHCRTSSLQQAKKAGEKNVCSFAITDLYDPQGLGGYSPRCPVTGVELSWVDDYSSRYAPRVGRYDPSQPFIGGGGGEKSNVVIMSRLGQKLTEGKRFTAYQEVENLLIEYPYVATAFAAWAAEHPVPSTDATNALLNHPRTEPVPPLPTIDEQRKKEQEFFRRHDEQVLAHQKRQQIVARTWGDNDNDGYPAASQDGSQEGYYTLADLRRDEEAQRLAKVSVSEHTPETEESKRALLQYMQQANEKEVVPRHPLNPFPKPDARPTPVPPPEPTPAKPLKQLSVHDILGGNWDED